MQCVVPTFRQYSPRVRIMRYSIIRLDVALPVSLHWLTPQYNTKHINPYNCYVCIITKVSLCT